MAVSFSQVASLVVQQLNANTSYTTTASDGRFYTNGIRDAINEADAFVVGVILADPSSPFRGRFTPTTSTVAHLGLIPAHLGPIISVTVDGEGAELRPKREIERERDNVLTLPYDKHYWVDENQRLYHNGTTATVTYFTFTMSATDPPTLQAPDEFAEVVSSKALAFLIDVEGENNAAANFYDTHWRASLAMLMGKGQ